MQQPSAERYSSQTPQTSAVYNLREHIIHLSGEVADEELMIQVVKMLEKSKETAAAAASGSVSNSGGNSPKQRNSPRTNTVPPLPLGNANLTNNTNSGPTDDELLANMGNPIFVGMGGGPTPQQTPRDNIRPLPRAHSDSDDNEDYTPVSETPQMTPRDGMPRGGRRIGVSAAPMILQPPSSFVPPNIEKSPEEFATLQDIVAGCHLFANMEDKERDVIVRALQRTSIAAGAEVLKQGHIPEKPQFYLLFAGTCEVIKSGKHVASLAVGNTFGELEIMYDSECAATIRCVTPCVLYFLDRDSYRNIVYKVSVDKQKKYLKLIENVSFLDALSEYDKSTLAEALVTGNYYSGDHIINFGERGNYMHIVIEGEVQVVGRERGKKVDVIRLGPGNVIGELEFLFDHLTIADVVAATKKVQTARISRKHFDMCVGITDELKAFVAKKGNYEHYLKEADDNVKKEIENLEKRVRKVEADQNVTVENIDSNGEIIMNQQVVDASGKEKQVAFRYPLQPLSSSSLLMIGLSEAGTIVYWSDMVARLTNYSAAEVIGQSLYTYIYSGSEQQALHTALVAANKHTGHVDEEYYSTVKSRTYTIQRSDGLTKTRMQLEIVPPCVAHGSGIAEVFLAIGHEVKSVPPVASNSSAIGWLTEQVRDAINDHEMDSESRLAQIGGFVTKFEQIQRTAMNPTGNENLNVVNIRELVGKVVMDYSQECIENNNTVTQNYDDLYQEDVYIDISLLPKCLKYAMSNCARHIKDANVVVAVSVIEDFGMEQLKFSFTDSGPGFPKKMIDLFRRSPTDMQHLTILQVKESVEKQGGRMVIESQPGKNCVSFNLPFIPDEGENLDEELSTSATAASMATTRHETYTTLLVEDTPSHKNLICKTLWDRKYAVLPGYTWGDVQRFSDQTDILIVDMSQRAMSELATKADPFSVLRDLSRTMSIILTGENIDEEMKNAANHAGFLTLKKPCTQIQAIQVLRKAEDKIRTMRADRVAIDATRAAFNENNRGEWKKGKILGRGAFGEVYEAIDVLTGGKMAVKYLKVPPDPNVRKEIHNEIEVMCGLQHPNIIHYFFAEDDVENNIIKVVMEYAGGGTLQSLLTDREQLSHEEYVRFLRDVVEGVHYIHSEGYVHRDLKTPNVLLNADQVGKLGDFGTAKRIRKNKNDPDDQVEIMYEMTGTLSYMAPEVLAAGSPEDDDDENSKPIGYSFPADIWSLGCVALEMATNKPPLHHLGVMTSMASITKYICGLRDVPDLTPLFNKDPAVIEFVSACMHPDPKKRPTAAQLREFSIFQEASSEEMKSAMKALKRAQLMAVLNSFVAFQDPDEKKKKSKPQSAAKRQKQEDNFFDSDDDDSDAVPREKQEDDFFASSDDEEESSPDGEKQEDDFFADSDDEDEEDEEAPKAPSPPPALNVIRSQTVGPLGQMDDDPAMSTRSAPVSTSNSISVDAASATSISNTVKTIPKSERTATIITNFSSNDRQDSTSGARHSTATTVGAIRSPTNGSHRNSHRHEDDDGDNEIGSPSHGDQLVICLHDALLMLVDQIGVEANDALREQYNTQKAAFPVSPGASTRTETAEVPQPPTDATTTTSPTTAGSTTRTPSNGNHFKPDIKALLASDAELIKTVAILLREKKAKSS